MAQNPNISQLDAQQIVKRLFNESNDSLRVDASLTADIQNVEVIITDAHDSIKIGDATGNYLKVNNDGSLNVSGTSTVSGTVNAKQSGLSEFKTSKYIVGTSPVQLAPTALSGRSSVSISVIADSNQIVFIGESSNSDGYPVYDRGSIQIDLDDGHQIWAKATSANQLVYVLELA